MKILVTTPTGNIGRKVVPELLAPEFSVRVITRDPARLPEEIPDQVEVVRGSTDDTATLRRALDGVEALFWCVPTELLQETDVRSHYERFARAGSQAIRKAGTPRVVTISAGSGLELPNRTMLLSFLLLLGATLGRPYPRLDFIHYIDDRRSGEFGKGWLVCPMSAGWKEGNEVPDNPGFRELFGLLGLETFRVSARHREQLWG